jgi:parvulin-like peptidyl-prolyl isomerase
MPRATLLIGIAIAHCLCGSGWCADPATVAAKVGADTISVGEVELEMRTALGDRKLEGEDREVLQAQTLGLLVNRQLVIQYLHRLKLGATELEIDKQVEQIAEQLKRRKQTLDDHVQKLGITKAELRRDLIWKTGWSKYLDSKLTDENLARYFKEHHSDFDGTRVHAAHLLLKVEKSGDPAAVQEMVDRAGELREQIVAKKLSFAEAAQKRSQAPTAAGGGDIGLISRHEPMPETFSEAAFELKPGETSEPVVTTFGVHLVHCLAVEPGKLTLQDEGVADAVRQDLIRYLFMWVSEKQRAQSKIEFTGALPHFDSETGKLGKAKN